MSGDALDVRILLKAGFDGGSLGWVGEGHILANRYWASLPGSHLSTLFRLILISCPQQINYIDTVITPIEWMKKLRHRLAFEYTG